MTLGEYVKEYREANKMTQRDFAQISDLTPGYISMLEKNKHPRTGKPITASLKTYYAVSKATGITLDALLDMVGDDVVVSLKDDEFITSEGDELDTKIMNLVKRLPNNLKLSLVDLLQAAVQGARKQ
jgi:transcriptional regulator with XRE-family HTH domain